MVSVKKDDKPFPPASSYRRIRLTTTFLDDPEYLKLYPNNLMIWEIIKFAKAKSCKTLHLGKLSREQ